MELEFQNATIGPSNVTIGSLKRHYRAPEFFIFYFFNLSLVKYCLQDDPYLCSCLSLIHKMIIENPPYLGKVENVGLRCLKPWKIIHLFDRNSSSWLFQFIHLGSYC